MLGVYAELTTCIFNARFYYSLMFLWAFLRLVFRAKTEKPGINILLSPITISKIIRKLRPYQKQFNI